MNTSERLAHWIRGAFAPDPNPVDSAAFGVLLVLAVLAPWAYGGVGRIGDGTTVTGNLFLELFSFLIAAAVFLRPSRATRQPVRLSLAALGGLVLLGAVQVLPLPRTVLNIISPVNAKIYHDSEQILELFGRGEPLPPRISIAPAETVRALLLLLAYGALFASAARLCRGRPRRRLLASGIVAASVPQIGIAALHDALEARIHGAFRNPDHLAGYLEVALALAFGALWSEVLVSSDPADRAEHLDTRVQRRFLPVAARTLLWSIIFLGIVLTRSRGGILAAVVSTLILLAMAVMHRRVAFRRRAALSAALFLLAGFLFASVAIGVAPIRRFLRADVNTSWQTRVLTWRASLDAWRDFPIVGSGLGTFREAFRRVQPRNMAARIEHAHSDYLELLTTGGAVGACLGVLLLGSFFVLLVQQWRNERHREESAFILAGIGALLSLTLHGMIESNLAIPPISATLACVMGTALAAASRTSSR